MAATTVWSAPEIDVRGVAELFDLGDHLVDLCLRRCAV